MTSFILKIIAMISMFIDHLGYAIFKNISCFNIIGRIAFPIFAFQISQGYLHTKSKPKYLSRLILFAIISQIPFTLFLSFVPNSSVYMLNIFFTLSIGLISILIYDRFFSNNRKMYKIFGLYTVAALAILAEITNCDYGAFGVAVIFMFYLFRNNKIIMSITFICACLLLYCASIIRLKSFYILCCIFTILPIVFICLYKGKQGRKIKYLLYAFYPLHLILLYFIFR